MKSLDSLIVNGKTYCYYSLKSLGTDLSRLPYSLRILLESVLRQSASPNDSNVTEKELRELCSWQPDGSKKIEIPFKPARVLLQDFTGVPAVVDLAAMRNAAKRLGGDPERINPLIPVDLVIDHSIQTDFFGCPEALEKNLDLEFQRNAERYSLLHWAQKSLTNFRVVPPSVGIIHQVNLEYLADVVHVQESSETEFPILYPDSVLGTDSHTVMINGLGVLGWGVGGIEAEAVMLGQPYYMLAPEVIGMELQGSLPPGVTATDLVLTITEMLRREGVVGKFVEYFGPGATTMPLADRAVLANMGPEYGATMGFFPVDEQTITYLRQTGRSEEQVQLVEAYCKAQALFRNPEAPTPNYSKVLTLNLETVQSCLAGPKRPQDRVPLTELKNAFQQALTAPTKDRGFGLSAEEAQKSAEIVYQDSTGTERYPIRHGALVIASITSCTNTSNPTLMITAGLLAKKAVEKGLKTPRFVKTSLAPGSRVVTAYLEKANLLSPLEQLGFHVAGYGCMTCIGNSGPLPEPVDKAINENQLVAAAVLSGNRNFEGRVNPSVKANYLASPPLVLAYALAGRVDIDLTSEALGVGTDGKPVFLKDIWPSEKEIAETAAVAVDPEIYRTRYENVFQSNSRWNSIATEPSKLFPWDKKSTYIQEPPFLVEMRMTRPDSIAPIDQARCLIALGDSVTTDHISPAGAIKPDSPAGLFLRESGVSVQDFNSYGSRRGNDRVMTRGTFANLRIRNLLAPGTEGGVTRYFQPDGQTEIMSVYDAAMKYKADGIPLVVLAGAEYGTGSSRDWAAKGTALLGVRAVIASSFERIHRGNLIGMGVLPLELPPEVNWQSLQLTGEESFTFPEIGLDFVPGSDIQVAAEREIEPDRFSEISFRVKVRIDTPVELQYYLHGGILQTVLRQLID